MILVYGAGARSQRMLHRVRLRFVCAVAASLAVAGCSFDRAGTADEFSLADSAAADAPVVDSSVVVDSPGIDTIMPEVGVDSSDVAVDVDAEVPVTGSLSVTAAPFTAFPVDLTSEGTISWAHWGLLTGETFTRKNGSGAIANAITPVPLRWDKYPAGFTWSDGDPNGVATATATGVYRFGPEALEFSTAAGTDSRVLRVYLATDSSAASATFTLSDGSAPAVVVTLPATGTMPGTGHRPQVVSATYRSSSPTARLSVRLVKTSSAGNAVSLFAATLQ